MKTTILAFAVSPLIPATIFGIAGAINVVVHSDRFGGALGVLSGFLIPFIFALAVAAGITWTFGVAVFVVFRALKIEGWISYSLAGLLLGAAYAFLTKQERAGEDLAFYFSEFSFFGFSGSVGFWAIRRNEPIQSPEPPR